MRKSFNDLVNWIVMDELESDKLEGWLRNARPMLEISNSAKQNEGSLMARVLKEVNSPHIAQASESYLSKLEDRILKMSHDELKSLNNYCIETWNKLANEGNVIGLDLTKACEMYNLDNTLCRAKDGNVTVSYTHLTLPTTPYV
eukprot:TRINITY_DN18503_c0_g1_i1.p1 TRINITY_DN18503_c0_g1~~TRINITY_DN18503_c0_g1_i1.p1  ORF type:complete len:144 (+),score=25.94 TRINITY_DN18503_c0_g1_i1:95-526(+)